MWGGWAPFSLFSLTLSQPQYRRFSSSVSTHRQNPHRLLWQNGSCVLLYTHLSSAKRSGACSFPLWGGELEKHSLVINRSRALDWLRGAGTERVGEKPFFLFFFFHIALRSSGEKHFENIFTNVCFNCFHKVRCIKKGSLCRGALSVILLILKLLTKQHCMSVPSCEK